MRLSHKLITACILLLICFNGKDAWCGYLSIDSVPGRISMSGSVSGLTPQANVKVYKRWNEEDITWKTWFKKGYTPVLLLVLTSLGVVILLGINNARLKRMIKKDYQDLWEAEENYYRLLEIVNDVVILITPDGEKILGVNQQAEKLTGYKRIDLLDMDIFSVTPPEEQIAVREFIENVKREVTVLASEMNILRNDKKIIRTVVKGRFIKGYTKTVTLLTFIEKPQV